MVNNIYQKILEESRNIEFKRVEDSRNWFREKASKVSKASVTPTNIINQLPSGLMNKKSIWKLVMYNYNPKGKKDLPYYDTFPIVFPFRMTEDGFYGFNLHYLPPKLRAILMDSFYSGSAKASKLFEPCIKRYILRNVRSKIAFIPENEWELALFLPTQRFQKQSEAFVWNQSLKSIGRKY